MQITDTVKKILRKDTAPLVPHQCITNIDADLPADWTKWNYLFSCQAEWSQTKLSLVWSNPQQIIL